MPLLYGVTPDDVVIPIQVDPSGRVIVGIESSANFTPPSNHVGFSNTALPAGISNQDAYTVPAGEYYRLTQDSLRYVGTVATVQIYGSIVRAGVTNVIHNFQGLTSNIAVGGTVNIILEPGDIFRVTIINATLNDDLHVALFMERIR